MENRMSSIKFKLGLLLPILVLVALFAAFWAASIVYQPQTFPPRDTPPPRLPDWEFYYFAHAIFSTVNIALLVVLVITFINVYVKTKSEFSIGLTVFAGVFLLKDLFSSPFVLQLFGLHASGLAQFAVIPDLFEFSALIVLLYLSAKY